MEVLVQLVKKWSRLIRTCLTVEILLSTCFQRVSPINYVIYLKLLARNPFLECQTYALDEQKLLSYRYELTQDEIIDLIWFKAHLKVHK